MPRAFARGFLFLRDVEPAGFQLRGRRSNPVRELLILIFLLISLWFCDIMAMRHSLILSCPKSMLVKT